MTRRIRYRVYRVDDKGMLERPREVWDGSRYPDRNTEQECLNDINSEDDCSDGLTILPVVSFDPDGN